MMINFDAEFQEDYRILKDSIEQTRIDLVEHLKRSNEIEKEKLLLSEEIRSLEQEKKNLLIQLDRLTIDEETKQFNSSRNLPQIYEKAFVHQFLSFPHSDDEEKILQQFEKISLNEENFYNLIVETISKIDSSLIESEKSSLIPLLVSSLILHPISSKRDELLKILFNLYKKPTFFERQILLRAFLFFAKQSGPSRIHAELLPQCWENLNHKIDERRCLVAETCGVLSPHFSKDIRVSLIFSMLQQMLLEDKSDQVRSASCRSLAMLINEIDDESRLIQCIDLLDRCFDDSADVVQSAKKYFLPSIAMWFLEQKKLYSNLIEHYLQKIETIVQSSTTSVDQQKFLQFFSILTNLIGFFFASAVKTLTISSDFSSTRSLPDDYPSEFYRFSMILSPQSDQYLSQYDQNAMNGEFPFSEQIQQNLDDFLKRSFDAMLMIDITNGKIVHSCSEFIKTLSRYFGRNFWKLKIKPIYQSTRVSTLPDEVQRKNSAAVLYATGVICSWTTEQELAELTTYLYDSLLLVANEKFSFQILQSIYSELGSDPNVQENLLNILRDSLTNPNSQIRLYTLQLFQILLNLVDHSIISHQILPALITLGSDDELTLRTATISVFGSILTQCSESEILERVYAQFQIFENDTTFRDEHRVQIEFIRTFTQIGPHVESRFREDFILPFLATIASQNSQQQTEKTSAKRMEIGILLFEAYNALSSSSSSYSSQSILNSFLPGLYCLRGDFSQIRPESIAVLDSIIKELELKLENSRHENSLIVTGIHFNQENIRGRMIKGLTNIRDSTEKLTYRFMKKK